MNGRRSTVNILLVGDPNINASRGCDYRDPIGGWKYNILELFIFIVTCAAVEL